MAPSCKLRFARFSARLKFQDRAECGNKSFCLAITARLVYNLSNAELGKVKDPRSLNQVYLYVKFLFFYILRSSSIKSSLLFGLVIVSLKFEHNRIGDF